MRQKSPGQAAGFAGLAVQHPVLVRCRAIGYTQDR
jgi:hypothetical protein